MSLAAFLARFRELHKKAGAGRLPPEEREEYQKRRDELARTLIAIQKLSLKPGETPRQSLRVARVLQVDLEWPKGKVRAVTLDISAGGFSTLMAKAPSQSDEVSCVFRLPGAEELEAKARVVNIAIQSAATAVRVAFAFVGLAEADRDRMEHVVFDTVLDQIAR